MATSGTQTISLRVPTELVERIDQSAIRNGETRTEYILNWLPDNYDEPARNTQHQG
jgi:predicted DNA-binding protein